MRPLGIPTFEVFQRAAAMVLETMYEQDFVDFSYACRPGRSTHQALTSMREVLMTIGMGLRVNPPAA